MHRTAARVDQNQAEIVKALRMIPGVTVELDHDDFLVGFKNRTYWIELKSSDAVSKKTGRIRQLAKKQSQIRLEREFTGHYKICSSLDDVLKEIGLL